MGWIDMRVVSPTHNPGNHGPYFVWSNNGYWFVVNKDSGRTKRIGRVGGKRINYFDRAIDIAYERNEKEQRKNANQN